MERWTLSIHWRANQTFQQRRCTPDPLQTLLLCLEEDLGATGIREREREKGEGFSRGKEKGKHKRRPHSGGKESRVQYLRRILNRSLIKSIPVFINRVYLQCLQEIEGKSKEIA